MSYKLYEVHQRLPIGRQPHQGERYTFAKERDTNLFPEEEGWVFTLLGTYEAQGERDSIFLQLYLAEKKDYFFFDYL